MELVAQGVSVACFDSDGASAQQTAEEIKGRGGKAIAAEVDRDADALGYDVTVAKSDGSERDLRVDGVSGRVIEDR